MKTKHVVLWCCILLIFVSSSEVAAKQHATQTESQTDNLRERLTRVEETDKRILEQLALIQKDITDLKTNMDKRFEELKADMRLQQSDLKADIRQQHSDINNWLIALFGGFIALLVGILGLAGIFVTHALGYWGINKSANRTDVQRLAEPQQQDMEAGQEA